MYGANLKWAGGLRFGRHATATAGDPRIRDAGQEAVPCGIGDEPDDGEALGRVVAPESDESDPAISRDSQEDATVPDCDEHGVSYGEGWVLP